jgi:hypothetical protein
MFNKAVSGKHCWRLLHNPNSLVARIIKEKQYPTIGRAYGQFGIYCLKWIYNREWCLNQNLEGQIVITPTFLGVQYFKIDC